MSAVWENSKSLRSPSTTTRALAVDRLQLVDERPHLRGLLVALHLARPASAAGTGRRAGRRRPWSRSGWPRRRTACPCQVNSPTSGLRLSVPGGVARVDPAGADRQVRLACRRPAPCTAVSASPPGRSTKPEPAVGAVEEDLPDVAARLAAVRVVVRVDRLREWYAGPPAAVMAATSLATVTSEATTPSSVAPLLSWISSSATRSGRLQVVRRSARPAGRTWSAGRSAPGSRR